MAAICRRGTVLNDTDYKEIINNIHDLAYLIISAFGRETSLDMFHAIGKVLYAKSEYIDEWDDFAT